MVYGEPLLQICGLSEYEVWNAKLGEQEPVRQKADKNYSYLGSNLEYFMKQLEQPFSSYIELQRFVQIHYF